ncbi:Phosphodiest-domain-containing protein [Microthyrium microscopicum]|uniref:Phosphodiest-domain-containing protein n=1 Tax=Microthyrium microscopicum TaxID=703497 RepID=A0A6A6UV31_9PEZI|nr:Phosphodiest-domain-containing protein [Microthyrium microscopicum]
MYHRPTRLRRRQRGRREARGEMVYDTEERGSISRSSSETDDLRPLKEARMVDEPRAKSKLARVLVHVGIIVFLLSILYGAYAATRNLRATKESAVKLVSNGTSLFAPTTLLISLDGFRADFLQRGLSPTLNAFVREGVSSLYMLPPFPSVTFVSHYTMATGLYPELHGIVGNSFWDPAMKDTFSYTDPKALKPEWWGGEPFWVTAEKQGIKTAIHMFPGSEAHIGNVDLAYVDKFNQTEALDNKVSRVLGWLDLPGPKSVETIKDAPRPQLIVAYVPDVDADGHAFGPNSTEVRDSIVKADDMLTKIFDGLKDRNLTDIVNVIIVSDHGMATTSVDRLIQLDDLVDMDKIEHTDGWPLYGLRPKKDADIEPIYHQLKAHAEENPYIEVYHKDKDMPAEYHFSNNPRIAPIWVVPQTGWAIVKKDEFNVEQAKNEGIVYSPRGLHGYDFRHPLMRAIFVARGPAFPHAPHSRIEAFPNINVYNIVCDSIGLKPVPNNGTVRLPLKPLGLHSDPHAPTLEVPEDLPEKGPGSVPTAPVSAKSSAISPTQSPTESPTQPPVPSPVVPEPKKDEDTKETEKPKSIWDWLKDSWDELKDKVEGIFKGEESSD